jgi:ubiquinone/menaquinone biosynthesis C-methylase UbiE
MSGDSRRPVRSLASLAAAVAILIVTYRVAMLIVAIRAVAAQEPSPARQPRTSGSPGEEKDAPAKAPAKPKAKAKAKAKARVRRDPPGFYMGRPIADVMSWQGAEWLLRETRIEEEQPEAMLNALKVPRGATVADVGAGVGYHSIRLARKVGPQGTVYATDVQPEMLRMLRDNARAARVTNIKPVRANQADTGLPERAIDLVLMVDVYHECSDPEATLQGLLAALKPRGRLVLVEFRGEDPEVPIKPEHKMTLEQVRREVEPQGFTFKESLEFLPWQHVIIFEKPEDKGVKTEKGGDTSRPSTPSADSKAP